MGVSQFVVYTSSDASGPGLLTGAAGTLGAALKTCLVDGYVGKSAAGWSNPVAAASNIYSFKNGAGSSGLGVVLNDNGPNVTSTYKEAWLTGWETVAGVGAPVGTGAGQFPTPAQLLTTGHCVIRKSAAADATGRSWIFAADAHTCYGWISTGDTADTYLHFSFGDCYSLKSTADAYRFYVYARAAENSATRQVTNSIAGTNSDWTDCIVHAGSSGGFANFPGHFIARTVGGGGTSALIARKGDGYAPSWSGASTYTYACPLHGYLNVPNIPDNSLVLAPLYLTESNTMLRGRYRGIWQVLHPWANFANGLTFDGGGDLAGRTFLLIGPGQVDANSTSYRSFWALETSNTVETN
jgi:hypothetical protein